MLKVNKNVIKRFCRRLQQLHIDAKVLAESDDVDAIRMWRDRWEALLDDITIWYRDRIVPQTHYIEDLINPPDQYEKTMEALNSLGNAQYLLPVAGPDWDEGLEMFCGVEYWEAPKYVLDDDKISQFSKQLETLMVPIKLKAKERRALRKVERDLRKRANLIRLLIADSEGE